MKTINDLRMEYKADTGFRWSKKNDECEEIATQAYTCWLEDKLLTAQDFVNKSVNTIMAIAK